MRLRRFLLIFAGSMVVVVLSSGGRIAQAQTSRDAALTGLVSSQEEGLMEGVLVRASRPDSTIAVTVVSNEKGRYSFPRGRLEPGRYSLNIRAVGYDLESPASAEIAAGKTAQLDLKLRKTQNLASQLSDAEWLWSSHGPDEQKRHLYECAHCHRLDRIFLSRHSADEWVNVLKRMDTYDNQSTPTRPQKNPAPTAEERAWRERFVEERVLVREQNMRAAGVQPPMSPQAEGAPTGATGYGAPGGITQDETRELAEWLSTVNLRQGKWSYELKTFPRVTGRGTRVIITEYALPRKETMVHDADYNPADGTVWYTDFGHQFVGNLDPRTGKVTEYPVPITDPTYPHGFNDTRTDIEGNVWFGNMSQVQLVKFDKKTRQIQTFRPPPELAIGSSIVMVMPYNTHVDGKIWTNNVGRAGVFRYDVNTGKWDIAYPYDYWLQDFDRHGVYGINSDAENNLYINAVGRNMVIKVDAKTLKARFYETPTSMSGPRRGRFDALYRLWVALTLVDKVAIFDPKTERFTEYAAPTPFSQAYDAMADEFGNVWWGGETSDRVYRLDPRTGEHTQYQLPKTHTDIRRVDVDSSTGMPVFWVGDCHSPAIFKVEPLD